jgi:hypothetical protein
MQPGNRDGEGVQKVDTTGGYRRRGMVIAWRRAAAAAHRVNQLPFKRCG